jgi:CRP/FNR family transcriptional regulator
MDTTVFRHLHTTLDTLDCGACPQRRHCLPAGMTDAEIASTNTHLVRARRKIDRGGELHHAGDAFEYVYAVRSGFFKTVLASADGREQVTGFQMGGELLGLDAIHSGVHGVAAVALEDSQVCAIQFPALQAQARQLPALQWQFHRMLASEIGRAQGVMMLLGSMNAEERLAAFLLDLTQRTRARGFSGTALMLRMTREEIGSYLGLSFETISRTFSKLQADGLLFVRHRNITVTDPVGLRHLVERAAA